MIVPAGVKISLAEKVKHSQDLNDSGHAQAGREWRREAWDWDRSISKEAKTDQPRDFRMLGYSDVL